MAEPLKNLFDANLINSIGIAVKNEYRLFKLDTFVADVFDQEWKNKELKQRLTHVTICLHKNIPLTYVAQIEILTSIAPNFTGFTALFFPEFVSTFGLDDYNVSIKALAYFTKYSSSEFAVRNFIVLYPDKMLKQHLIWAKDKNHHVRRLASEGIRPRLPWAMALTQFKKDPTPIIPILELLKADESEYVRKSVANCLNDISKDNPEILLQIVKKWKGNDKNTDWIIKHASRGLLKKGSIQALQLFGLNHQLNVEVLNLMLNKLALKIGETLSFETTVYLNENAAQQIRMEYNIYYMKSNGKTSPKIFQIGTYQVKPKQHLTLKRSHKFIELSTRKHYPGEHVLALVINGKEVAQQKFMLH